VVNRDGSKPRKGDAVSTSGLVRVSVFPSIADAQIAQGVLDEAGIESMVQSDNAGGMYPALDAAALLVRSEDIEAATDALNRRHRA
jgi:hypothetical protein